VGSRARRRERDESSSAEPYIPSLRIVGTTWQARGFAYGIRRFWYAVFLLFVVVVVALPGVLGLLRLSRAAFWVTLAVAVVVALAGAALEWWRSAHRLRADYTAADYRLAVVAVLVVWLAWILLPVGGAIVLALGSPVLTGPMLAQLLRACFDRELWPEREWRMTGLSPAERRRAEQEKGWLPARVRGVDRLHQGKPDSRVHPHE
jgi:hypothetical protein